MGRLIHVVGAGPSTLLQNGTNPDPQTPPPTQRPSPDFWRPVQISAEALGSQSRDQYLLSGSEVVLVPW